ncbi:hypothetical protein TNIN_380421 [Trichonephila inaurata madagascariensis]|uniref:Uncharacterized protein n=1 Tax=Trichonephila inaurata madagascariensis TaxID=2747483 RepID=A0A8X6X3V1_9ARAC|nr:hypothetical protein TNIN_380421 [Trichonephila inaurata madagascariensis]
MNQRGGQLWGKSPQKAKKTDKAKTNDKKPSKKQKKKICVSLSSSSEKIPLDTSGDSFDVDNNDYFCVAHKEYFYAKKNIPSVTEFSGSNATMKIEMIIICTGCDVV